MPKWVVVFGFCLSVVFSVQAANKTTKESMAIAVAQQSVLKHHPREDHLHFSIAFDVVYLHPQPEGNYWAVVGGYKAKRGNRYYTHEFVAAVRLLCSNFKELKCWTVDKLAIDDRILFK